MKNKNNGRSSAGRQEPAFLASHRGFEPQSHVPSLRGWSPAREGRQSNQVAASLPRLTAELGFVMAGRDVTVEVLPGTPTTVIFSSGGELLSLMVLPVSETEARRTLGIPSASTRDIAAEALYEEQREVLPPDELLAEAQLDVFGL